MTIGHSAGLATTQNVGIKRAEPEFQNRLRELSGLKNGWLDGEGVAPSPDGLKWLQDVWSTQGERLALPAPYLYPTLGGGLSLEWDHPAAISLEVNLSTRLGDVDCEGFSGTLDLAAPNGWEKLQRLFQGLS